MPFHELAHLIMAVLFSYKTTDVALYRPIVGEVDGNPGYVEYKQGGDLYRKIGSFFVGIAPRIFGAILLFILMKWAFPAALLLFMGSLENELRTKGHDAQYGTTDYFRV